MADYNKQAAPNPLNYKMQEGQKGTCWEGSTWYYSNLIYTYKKNQDEAIDLIKSTLTQIDNIKKSFSSAKGDMITKIIKDLDKILKSLNDLKGTIESKKKKAVDKANNCDKVASRAISERNSLTLVDVESDGLIYKKAYTKLDNDKTKDTSDYYMITTLSVVPESTMMAGKLEWVTVQQTSVLNGPVFRKNTNK